MLRETGFSGCDDTIQTMIILTCKQSQPFSVPHFESVVAVSALWEAQEADCSKEWIVLLDDPSNLTLLKSTQERLVFLQAIFTSAKGILWIIQGSEGSDPRSHMVQGFVASSRNEIPGLRLSLVDLDGSSAMSKRENVDMIATLLIRGLISNAEKEIEDLIFKKIGDIISIPRIMPDAFMNEVIGAEIGHLYPCPSIIPDLDVPPKP